MRGDRLSGVATAHDFRCRSTPTLHESGLVRIRWRPSECTFTLPYAGARRARAGHSSARRGRLSLSACRRQSDNHRNGGTHSTNNPLDMRWLCHPSIRQSRGMWRSRKSRIRTPDNRGGMCCTDIASARAISCSLRQPGHGTVPRGGGSADLQWPSINAEHARRMT